jgi:hypothetical protein
MTLSPAKTGLSKKKYRMPDHIRSAERLQMTIPYYFTIPMPGWKNARPDKRDQPCNPAEGDILKLG